MYFSRLIINLIINIFLPSQIWALHSPISLKINNKPDMISTFYSLTFKNHLK